MSCMLLGGEVLFEVCYSPARAAFTEGNRKRGGEAPADESMTRMQYAWDFVLCPCALVLRSFRGGRGIVWPG